jgi:hypothetical protein
MTTAIQSATPSVSAGIAEANAHPPQSPPVSLRFPGEDAGRSLAEIAGNDLDAALQLLAERAEYITGASGAAIALRRAENLDMLCRASAGSNAPELGALLSTEYGLSGESVRTRQLMRCDDAERDPRVNRDVCRQLGIASVVVMPIVSDEHVLGVFELFSGNPRAFGERDLAALTRLGGMVEIAVKHAVVMQTMPPPVQSPAAEHPPEPHPEAKPQPQPEAQSSAPAIGAEAIEADLLPDSALVLDLAPAAPEEDILLLDSEIQEPAPQELKPHALEKTETQVPAPEPATKKPLFWSAPAQTEPDAARSDQSPESTPVPVGLRNLQKCKACGFPVSQGRIFCVECEEKRWRGRPLPPSLQTPRRSERAKAETNMSASAPAVAPAPENFVAPSKPAAQISADPATNIVDSPPQASAPDNSAMFLASAAPSESWLASHKYILGAMLVVALVIAAVAWLR